MTTTFYFEEVTDEIDVEEERSPHTIIKQDTGKKSQIPASMNMDRIEYIALKSCPAIVGGGATLTMIGRNAFAYGGCTRTGKGSGSIHCYDIGMFSFTSTSYNHVLIFRTCFFSINIRSF
jgi:hypothetical protein